MPDTKTDLGVTRKKWLRLSLTALLVVLCASIMLSVTAFVPSATAEAPATNVAGPITIVTAFTAGATQDYQTTFNRGDVIRYRANIDNTSFAPLTVPFTWTASGPCGTQVLWTGNMDVPAYGSSWTLSGSIPATACVGTYTFTISATYNGQTASQSSQYYVTAPTIGAVRVVSAWTANAQDVTKDVFSPGEEIHYRGNVENTSSIAVTAPFTWTVTGPCGSQVLFTGNENVAPLGTSWTLTGTIASTACPGLYTFTLTTAFQGVVSSQSSTYSVIGATGGQISTVAVWTTDAFDHVKQLFQPGESIRYHANFDNQTGVQASVPITWSVASPCGSTVIWSGNLNIPNAGSSWYIETVVPLNACLGQYTAVVSLDYNGRNSSQSGQYQVVAPFPGVVRIISAWTTDSAGTFDTVFRAGETVAFRGNIDNGLAISVTAPLTWTLQGPGGTQVLAGGNVSLPAGGSSWVLTSTISNTAVPGNYTFSLSTLYAGFLSTQTSSFTVIGSSNSVVALSAWTTNESGNASKTFNAGEPIRYFASIYNGGNAAVTAKLDWKLSGPCGATSLWSGDVTTGQNVWTWEVPTTVRGNTCAGTYGFTIDVTRNGQTTSQSATYKVSNSWILTNTLNLPLIGRFTNGQSAAAEVTSGGLQPLGKPAATEAVIVTGKPMMLETFATGASARSASVLGVPQLASAQQNTISVIILGEPFSTPLPTSSAAAVITGKPEWVPWKR
jgi:uncharacterized membrane protein